MWPRCCTFLAKSQGSSGHINQSWTWMAWNVTHNKNDTQASSPSDRPRTSRGRKCFVNEDTTLGAAEIETKFTNISLGINKKKLICWIVNIVSILPSSWTGTLKYSKSRRYFVTLTLCGTAELEWQPLRRWDSNSRDLNIVFYATSCGLEWGFNWRYSVPIFTRYSYIARIVA